MTSSLFRAQALRFSQDQAFGEAVFYQPLSLGFASAALLIVVLALLSFAAFAPISQTELVRGHLQASQGSLRVFGIKKASWLDFNIYFELLNIN